MPPKWLGHATSSGFVFGSPILRAVPLSRGRVLQQHVHVSVKRDWNVDLLERKQRARNALKDIASNTNSAFDRRNIIITNYQAASCIVAGRRPGTRQAAVSKQGTGTLRLLRVYFLISMIAHAATSPLPLHLYEPPLGRRR